MKSAFTEDKTPVPGREGIEDQRLCRQVPGRGHAIAKGSWAPSQVSRCSWKKLCITAVAPEASRTGEVQ